MACCGLFLLSMLAGCGSGYQPMLKSPYALGVVLDCRAAAEALRLYPYTAHILDTDVRRLRYAETFEPEFVEVDIVAADYATTSPLQPQGDRDYVTCWFDGDVLLRLVHNGRDIALEQPPLYRVYFDWNEAVLTAQAMDILRRVAEDAKSATYLRIAVTGHADTSGTEPFNMRLSQRRAKVVAAALVQMGVDRKAISTVARGQNDLLVPTPNGVRERKNRRARIVIER